MENEPNKNWGCRFEVDEDSGEPRVILDIGHLPQEAMREMVRGLIEGSLYPSTAVRDEDKSMVFMPLLFGALSPPEEAIREVMGSVSPPETVEDDPPKPEHPGYPNRNEDPPERPTVRRADPEMKFKMEWDDIEEEEWEAHLAEVNEENKKIIREWQDAHNAWMDSLDEIQEERQKIDAAHRESLAAWEAEMAAHTEREAGRAKAKEEWTAKYDRIFSRWAEDLGCLIGDMQKTFGRSINGYPIFHAFSIVHREDWHRIDAAARREADRLANIEV